MLNSMLFDVSTDGSYHLFCFQRFHTFAMRCAKVPAVLNYVSSVAHFITLFCYAILRRSKCAIFHLF